MKKNIVTAVSILATVYYVYDALSDFNFSDRKLLMGFFIFIFPYIIRSIISGYFLVYSLFNKAKDIDDGNWVTIVAFFGTNLTMIIGLVFQINNPYPNMNLLSIGVILSVMVFPFFFVGLVTLGYNLTILPEANTLNIKGIYSISRHPLYLSYIIWFVVGNFISQSLIMIFLSTIQIGLMILRAKYEERILEKNFAEYYEYKKNVGWLGRNRNLVKSLRDQT